MIKYYDFPHVHDKHKSLNGNIDDNYKRFLKTVIKQIHLFSDRKYIHSKIVRFFEAFVVEHFFKNIFRRKCFENFSEKMF